MSVKAKKRVLLACCVWIVYFTVPDPRTAIDYVFGSGIRNPQYLFADSDREACRRLRRVVENGKVNIYVENLPTHKMLISLTQKQIRALINLCSLRKSDS